MNALTEKFLNLKNAGAATILMLSAFACTTEVQDLTYEEIDANNDNVVNQREFTEAFQNTNYFKSWNEDARGALSQDEFFTGFYNYWDLNNDGGIRQEEWEYATENYFSLYNESTWGSFDEWDINDNGSIERNEFNNALDDTQYFASMDVDNDDEIDEDEFFHQIFNFWDLNNNGLVDQQEFDEVYATNFN